MKRVQRAPAEAAIAYVRSAVTPLTVPELERLHQQAMDWNARHGITGVLLHNDGDFMQYVEGPATARWQRPQATTTDVHAHSPGLALLHSFWRRRQG